MRKTATEVHAVLKKYMKVNVYHTQKFLSGLNDLRDVKRVMTKKVRSVLKEPRFDSMETMKPKTTEVLNKLTETGFQHCFEQRKIRMEPCKHR